ncbi:MAG: peptide chain release factor 1 [Methylacidiphilales bacterium]|nr:peptide chain release factor 1 [Candidatus Methylacidiphilales bacterium]MDW8349608.1 peptide chain release factor 1 [Verrucomicrobiae bacterium]
MDLSPHIQRLKARLTRLEDELASGVVFTIDPKRAQSLTKEHNKIKQLLRDWEQLLQTESELAKTKALINDPHHTDLAELAQQEIPTLEARRQQLHTAILLGILPPDENESRNTILEIRAGTGGHEAALFAADLFRMYSRYAERKGWKIEIHDISPSDLGGFKEIIFQVNGEDVFRTLRFESGVHRVQRVPATEAQGRIHTSTATVAVLPEAQEVDLVIKPEELRIEVCRASGPGGQGVNTTDSAVQVMHIPTGMIVRCQDSRSQIKNREKAISILRARLLQKKQSEEAAKYASARKAQVGTGDRNEKIRTYNYPQNRITDHRINFTLYNLSAFMDGDIEPLLQALLQDDIQRRLAQLETEPTAHL